MDPHNTKWVLCFLFLFSFVLPASAETLQTDSPRNVITVEPIDLIWKAHVVYEHVLNNKFSVGAGVHYYFDDAVGPYYKADLFCRFYYHSIFYIQPMLSAGTFPYFYEKSLGGSFSWGFKRVFPKSHITLDVSIGFQVYPYPGPYSDALEEFAWYLFYQGAVLIPRFGIGYAF